MSVGQNVACPFCGAALWDDGSLAGQEVACPHCRGRMVMPGGLGATGAQGARRVEHVHRLDRSPGVAAVLSFFWPGLGQVYCGRMARGLAFLAAGPVIAGGAALAVLRVLDQTGAAQEGAALEDVGAVAGVAVAGAVIAGAVWLWNVLDAYACASRPARKRRRR